MSSPPGKQDCSKLEPFALGQVQLHLKRLDFTKATSTEYYSTWISLEGRGVNICIPLLDIINTMLLTGEYPHMWNRAEVTPLSKITSPHMYKHYRPISLLFHLGKLAEGVIIFKVTDTLTRIIEPNNYAYQSNICNTDVILHFLDYNLSQREKPSVKFLQICIFLKFLTGFYHQLFLIKCMSMALTQT